MDIYTCTHGAVSNFLLSIFLSICEWVGHTIRFSRLANPKRVFNSHSKQKTKQTKQTKQNKTRKCYTNVWYVEVVVVGVSFYM